MLGFREDRIKIDVNPFVKFGKFGSCFYFETQNPIYYLLALCWPRFREVGMVVDCNVANGGKCFSSLCCPLC